MNEPCRFVNKELANLDFWHGGNPVLDWMISNVTIQQSNMGQIRPSKDKSVDKIDMVVASLMAIGGYIYPDSTIISDIRGLG
jgi:phage terminase large subunit-like protein